MGISKKQKPVEEETSVNVVEEAKEQQQLTEEVSDLISESDDVSTDNFSSSDDSDDEVVLNRSGSVPAAWYESEDHRGYDIYGKKVTKTLMSSKIDELLRNAEDPNSWRTVQDLQNEREVYLTDADIEIIRRLRAGKYPDAKVGDEGYFVEYDDAPHQLHPVRNKDLPKSRFLASKDETKEIRKLVKLIRAGKLVPRRHRQVRKSPADGLYDLWAQAEQEHGRIRGPSHLPAPKMPLPGHAESYHPPEEFLFTDEEKKEWLAGDDSTRPTTFIPENYPSLRRVPWYSAFITERFSRCLDLYTVPRMMKKKMNVDPESLIPQLPQMSDLRPFPTSLSVEFVGHTSAVLGANPSPSGEWVASCSADSVRVWDMTSGKCVLTLADKFNATCIAWHPSAHRPMLAVGDDDGNIHFLSLTQFIVDQSEASDEPSVEESLRIPADSATNWKKFDIQSDSGVQGVTFVSGTTTGITSLSWHQKGNFLAAVSAQSPSKEKSCFVISFGSKKHVCPLKGKAQSIGSARHVIFHPSKPHLVVAGSSSIATYDLKAQARVNMLGANSNHVSSVAVHPAADGMHVIASSLDNKVIWFDSEVRNKPWKNFRHHTSAVRKVTIHSRAAQNLPLMASAGDDKCAHVLYAKVFEDDSTRNPMVVPVKKLSHPDIVRDCQWHPVLPWLITACDDGIVRLWA